MAVGVRPSAPPGVPRRRPTARRRRLVADRCTRCRLPRFRALREDRLDVARSGCRGTARAGTTTGRSRSTSTLWPCRARMRSPVGSSSNRCSSLWAHHPDHVVARDGPTGRLAAPQAAPAPGTQPAAVQRQADRGLRVAHDVRHLLGGADVAVGGHALGLGDGGSRSDAGRVTGRVPSGRSRPATITIRAQLSREGLVRVTMRLWPLACRMSRTRGRCRSRRRARRSWSVVTRTVAPGFSRRRRSAPPRRPGSERLRHRRRRDRPLFTDLTPHSLDMTPPWCHDGVMDIGEYVTELQRQLVQAAENGNDDTRAVAERLAAGLDSATRLVLLDALSAAAGEITRDLAPGAVDVRLRGREIEFVVTRRSTAATPTTTPSPRLTSTTRAPRAPHSVCPTLSRHGSTTRRRPMGCPSTPGWSARSRQPSSPSNDEPRSARCAPATASPAGCARPPGSHDIHAP